MNDINMIVFGITLFIAVLLALIPACIAKSKHRSFALFFIFGLILIIPAIIVAVAVGDPYQREKVSGKGIWMTLLIGATIVVFRPLFDYVDRLSIIWVERYNPELNDVITAILAFSILFICIIVSFIIAMIIADILYVPIMSLSSSYNEKAFQFNENNPSGSAKKTLFKGIIIAPVLFLIIRKFQIKNNISVYNQNHPDDPI